MSSKPYTITTSGKSVDVDEIGLVSALTNSGANVVITVNNKFDPRSSMSSLHLALKGQVELAPQKERYQALVIFDKGVVDNHGVNAEDYAEQLLGALRAFGFRRVVVHVGESDTEKWIKDVNRTLDAMEEDEGDGLDGHYENEGMAARNELAVVPGAIPTQRELRTAFNKAMSTISGGKIAAYFNAKGADFKVPEDGRSKPITKAFLSFLNGREANISTWCEFKTGIPFHFGQFRGVNDVYPDSFRLNVIITPMGAIRQEHMPVLTEYVNWVFQKDYGHLQSLKVPGVNVKVNVKSGENQVWTEGMPKYVYKSGYQLAADDNVNEFRDIDDRFKILHEMDRQDWDGFNLEDSLYRRGNEDIVERYIKWKTDINVSFIRRYPTSEVEIVGDHARYTYTLPVRRFLPNWPSPTEEEKRAAVLSNEEKALITNALLHIIRSKTADARKNGRPVDNDEFKLIITDN